MATSTILSLLLYHFAHIHTDNSNFQNFQVIWIFTWKYFFLIRMQYRTAAAKTAKFAILFHPPVSTNSPTLLSVSNQGVPEQWPLRASADQPMSFHFVEET
jgi:hypothetical protein